VGSETFVALVDANQAPYRHDLRQLGIAALCTNRDLPLFMPIGAHKSDFTLPMPGPIVFGRGLEITLDFDENAFRGTGVFLLGAVFERFLARYVSINSFT
ncbi:type VI secretion system baseplate subunit TssF, partial [Escherichia coli]|uniref:type VI secretion system baseplate subunit TssF n=1 Tax=Escherichia coli TaxID=562 RepID=UPI000FEF8DB7